MNKKIIRTANKFNATNQPTELAILAPYITDKVCSNTELEAFFTEDARLNTLNAKSLIDIQKRVNYLVENTSDSRARKELLVVSHKLFTIIEKTLDLSEIHNNCASRKEAEQ